MRESENSQVEGRMYMTGKINVKEKIHLLLSLPLFHPPCSSAVITCLPIYSFSLLITWPSHLSLAFGAFFDVYEVSLFPWLISCPLYSCHTSMATSTSCCALLTYTHPQIRCFHSMQHCQPHLSPLKRMYKIQSSWHFCHSKCLLPVKSSYLSCFVCLPVHVSFFMLLSSLIPPLLISVPFCLKV